VPQVALEEHPRGIDGDALRLLILQGVEQERILEGLRVELALGPHLLELSFRKRVGVRQQAADHRALAVVHVTHDHDVHALGGARRSGDAGFLGSDGSHPGQTSLCKRPSGRTGSCGVRSLHTLRPGSNGVQTLPPGACSCCQPLCGTASAAVFTACRYS
jgi:hypothetical protein